MVAKMTILAGNKFRRKPQGRKGGGGGAAQEIDAVAILRVAVDADPFAQVRQRGREVVGERGAEGGGVGFHG